MPADVIPGHVVAAHLCSRLMLASANTPASPHSALTSAKLQSLGYLRPDKAVSEELGCRMMRPMRRRRPLQVLCSYQPKRRGLAARTIQISQLQPFVRGSILQKHARVSAHDPAGRRLHGGCLQASGGAGSSGVNPPHPRQLHTCGTDD
eukprot:350494-Chlamydomonas_euryale.AAC.17